jgi:hypothetical protein
MVNKKLLFSIIFCLSLCFCSQAIAARLVPHNAPLQPIPQGTAANVSNNVNSDNSESNISAKQQSDAVEQSQQTPDQSQPTPSPTPTPTPPSVNETPYWILIFIGIIGLAGVGAWLYFRFMRKK